MLTYSVNLKKRFRRDYALCARRGLDMAKVDAAIRLLATGAPLPPSFRDHALKGTFGGLRECHLAGDWLLVYSRDDTHLVVHMMRTGTHQDIFGE